MICGFISEMILHNEQLQSGNLTAKRSQFVQPVATVNSNSSNTDRIFQWHQQEFSSICPPSNRFVKVQTKRFKLAWCWNSLQFVFGFSRNSHVETGRKQIALLAWCRKTWLSTPRYPSSTFKITKTVSQTFSLNYLTSNRKYRSTYWSTCYI